MMVANSLYGPGNVDSICMNGKQKYVSWAGFCIAGMQCIGSPFPHIFFFPSDPARKKRSQEMGDVDDFMRFK
jgi:hypothetical protein